MLLNSFVTLQAIQAAALSCLSSMLHVCKCLNQQPCQPPACKNQHPPASRCWWLGMDWRF